MAGEHESRPLAELLGGLAGDISTLFRQEVQLAKTEASEKVVETVAGVSSIAIGGVLALGALGVFLAALVALLSALLVHQGFDLTLANLIAACVVAGVVGIVAWVTVAKGVNTLKASNLNMNRTTASLGRAADIVKERL